jgi:hypothetical protein
MVNRQPLGKRSHRRKVMKIQRLLVHDSVVTGRMALRVDRRVGEEAEDVQAIIHGDVNNIAIFYERAWVVIIAGSHERPPP